MLPVELELIPTTSPPAVVGVALILSTPEVAPMVFPVIVPTFTSPVEVRLIPQITPLVVEAPLDVVSVKFVNVLFWTFEAVPATVPILMAINLAATPEANPQAVPVPFGFDPPMILLLTVYPLPLLIKIAL